MDKGSPSCPSTNSFSIFWLRQREIPLWHLHISKGGLSPLVLTSTPCCYKPGDQHVNAEALSHLPLPDHPKDVPLPRKLVLLFEMLNSSPLTATEIRALTDKAPLLSRVCNNVLRGWYDTDQPPIRLYQTRSSELSVQDWYLLWGSRMVVPRRGRAIVQSLLHEGHPRITRMKTLACGYVW